MARRFRSSAAGVLVVLGVLSTTARAATFDVTDAPGLQAALAAAAINGEDDLIRLAAGSYSTAANGNATFSYSTALGFALTLEGAGAGASILTGDDARQVIELTSGAGGADVTLRDLGIADGRITAGSAFGAGAEIEVSGEALIERCAFTGNGAAPPANSSVFGGALFCAADGACRIRDTTFASTSAATSGSGSVFGGALDFDSPIVEITLVSVTGQVTQVSGSGSVFGGAVDVSSSVNGFQLSIDGLTLLGGQVTKSGTGSIFGGILDVSVGGDGAVETIRGLEIAGATVGESGDGSVFGGVASLGGGGGGEALSLFAAHIHDNSVSEAGGGTVYGGALSFGGGGSGSLFTMVNCAIGENTISELDEGNAYGGGVDASGSVRLVHNTIWNNRVTEGGGDGASGGGFSHGSGGATVDLYNNLVWGNSTTGSGQDIEFGGGSNTLNLFHNDSSDLLLSGGGNTVNQAGNLSVDPLFAGDFHLSPGSPVLDQADPGAPDQPADDFDGDLRPIGAGPDIGADELGATADWVAIPTLSGAGTALLALALAAAALRRTRRPAARR
jgi:hypothetical protein